MVLQGKVLTKLQTYTKTLHIKYLTKAPPHPVQMYIFYRYSQWTAQLPEKQPHQSLPTYSSGSKPTKPEIKLEHRLGTIIAKRSPI